MGYFLRYIKKKKRFVAHAGLDADDSRVVPKYPSAGAEHHRKGGGAHVAQGWTAAWVRWDEMDERDKRHERVRGNERGERK